MSVGRTPSESLIYIDMIVCVGTERRESDKLQFKRIPLTLLLNRKSPCMYPNHDIYMGGATDWLPFVKVVCPILRKYMTELAHLYVNNKDYHRRSNRHPK